LPIVIGNPDNETPPWPECGGKTLAYATHEGSAILICLVIHVDLGSSEGHGLPGWRSV